MSNESGCSQFSCAYQFEPSLGIKVFREQIAADFQVSAESVVIKVGKEVVSDTCRYEMLEAIEQGRKFTLVVKKSNLCPSSVICSEVVKIGNGQARKVWQNANHGCPWLLNKVKSGIRLEITVKQQSRINKREMKKPTPESSTLQMRSEGPVEVTVKQQGLDKKEELKKLTPKCSTQQTLSKCGTKMDKLTLCESKKSVGKSDKMKIPVDHFPALALTTDKLPKLCPVPQQTCIVPGPNKPYFSADPGLNHGKTLLPQQVCPVEISKRGPTQGERKKLDKLQHLGLENQDLLLEALREAKGDVKLVAQWLQ